MKKSLLITTHFPPDFGGEQVFYYHVCKNLPGDKIVVLAPESSRAEKFDENQNFTIIRKNIISTMPLKRINRIFKFIKSIKWLSSIKDINQIVKNHKIELIQAGQILPIGTLAMIYKKRKKIPYIFYAHGLDITVPQKNTRKKILMGKIIKEAQAIIANSNFTKDELIKLGAEEDKIYVIHPCPNINVQETTSKKIAELTKTYNLESKKIILTVGRLIPRKGHEEVINALPEIIKKVPNVMYLITGDGPTKNKLNHLVVQKNLQNYVKFLGAVTDQELAEIYHLSDVFIMPNKQLANGDVEGFGIVFIEANSYGKPVIGGRNGGVPEAIIDGQTGLLVNPTDQNDIVEKTTRLLTDTAYAAKLGLQGLSRANEEFDWKNQTEKIKQILK